MGRFADTLRNMAARGQYGHSRTPDNFYVGELYVSFARHARPEDGLSWNDGSWQKLVSLSKRYLSFVRYCREYAPKWETVREIRYADNSIEEEQEARDGSGRTRQVNDACAGRGRMLLA